MPRLLDPKGESGRAILFEAYAGEPILGVRTSRYLYTEWDDPNSVLPQRELYDTYADPYQLTNLANDPAYLPVVLELGDELDDLIDCAGASCQSAPTGTLSFTNGGVGKNGCVFPPVTAHFFGANEDKIVNVGVRAGRVNAGDDTEPPFDVPIPDQALRDELPEAAEVVGKALYEDGRRLALTGDVRICE
jgi:hypothetical protein